MTDEISPMSIDSFIASLEGKPMLFAKNVRIKEADTLNIREATKVEELEPYKMSYTLTATVENSTEVSRNIRRLMGQYRPNRGKGLTTRQYVYRHRYYAWRTGCCKSLKETRTLGDVRKYKPKPLPF